MEYYTTPLEEFNGDDIQDVSYFLRKSIHHITESAHNPDKNLTEKQVYERCKKSLKQTQLIIESYLIYHEPRKVINIDVGNMSQKEAVKAIKQRINEAGGISPWLETRDD